MKYQSRTIILAASSLAFLAMPSMATCSIDNGNVDGAVGAGAKTEATKTKAAAKPKTESKTKAAAEDIDAIKAELKSEKEKNLALSQELQAAKNTISEHEDAAEDGRDEIKRLTEALALAESGGIKVSAEDDADADPLFVAYVGPAASTTINGVAFDGDAPTEIPASKRAWFEAKVEGNPSLEFAEAPEDE